MSAVQFTGVEAGCILSVEDFDEKRFSALRIVATKLVAKTCSESSLSNSDLEVLYRTVDAVSRRSAQLAAAMIASLARRMRRAGTLTEHARLDIAVDGSVFKLYPGYRKRLAETLDEILQETGIGDAAVSVVDAVEDGSGVGAAAVLACAS